MWPHDCGKCGSGDFCQLVITDVDSKAGLWVTVFLGTFLLPYFSFVPAHISFMPWTNYVVNRGKLASILFGFKMSSVVFLLVLLFAFLMKNWGFILNVFPMSLLLALWCLTHWLRRHPSAFSDIIYTVEHTTDIHVQYTQEKLHQIWCKSRHLTTGYAPSIVLSPLASAVSLLTPKVYFVYCTESELLF